MRVVLDNVGHSFDRKHWLFRDLSVAFEPGRVYAVTGPSGSGKSTLMSILARWLTPAQGSVDASSIETTALVFQNPHGTPQRTAKDHVALPLLARGLRARDADMRAGGLLRRFQLERVANERFSQLSGGEAQRLMLARAFAVAPSLLLIDEPTAQLDRSTAFSVNRSIASIGQEGTIVVVATHDAETTEMCTDVVDLHGYSNSSAVHGS